MDGSVYVYYISIEIGVLPSLCVATVTRHAAAAKNGEACETGMTDDPSGPRRRDVPFTDGMLPMLPSSGKNSPFG